MTTTTEAELLRAVAADLDDRGAWQVYLDWLLEREDPRAELFRLQTSLEDVDDERERKELDRQVSALLAEHEERWLAEVNALGLPIRWGMERGVVGRVAGTPDELARSASAIVEAAPLLLSITIHVGGTERERDLSPLAGSPLLARARTLSIRGSTARVTGWGHLVAPELRALDLHMIALGPEDVETLVGQGLAKLASLEIGWSRLNKGALDPLAKLIAPKLERFDLSAGHIGPPLGSIVAAFPGLRFVRIPGNELGSEALATLLPALANASHVDLRGNELVASDVAPLLKALGHVRVLKLGGNNLGTKGVEQLAAWPGAKRLVHLDINHDSDKGARAIANSKHLSLALEKLTLGVQRVAERVEHALLDAPNLANARIHVGMKTLGRKKRADALAKAKKPVKKPTTKPAKKRAR